MTGDSVEWVTEQLVTFLHASEMKHVPPPAGVISGGSYRPSASEDEVLRRWAVVERILQRHLPDWPQRVGPGDGFTYTGYRWRERREAATLCLAGIHAEEELKRHLASPGPSLYAESLHPWVWEAARSAWEAGQFDDAVDAAARNVNSQMRAKTGRKDIGEQDLVAQLFSDKPADAANPRLRLPLAPHLGDKTVASIYAGVLAFGRGLFSAVRNPLAHEAPGATEITEAEALESLAAFSLLARWVDRASVHRS